MYIYICIYLYMYIYIYSILSPYTSIFVGESHPSDTMSSPAESWSHLRCQSPLKGGIQLENFFAARIFLGWERDGMGIFREH